MTIISNIAAAACLAVLALGTAAKAATFQVSSSGTLTTKSAASVIANGAAYDLMVQFDANDTPVSKLTPPQYSNASGSLEIQGFGVFVIDTVSEAGFGSGLAIGFGGPDFLPGIQATTLFEGPIIRFFNGSSGFGVSPSDYLAATDASQMTISMAEERSRHSPFPCFQPGIWIDKHARACSAASQRVAVACGIGRDAGLQTSRGCGVGLGAGVPLHARN